MRYRRLGWAGVELDYEGETLLIDYIRDTRPLAPVLRSPEEAFPVASNIGRTAGALLTHLHADHADADALAEALLPGAPVLRPEQAGGGADDRELTAYAEEKFSRLNLSTEIVGLWHESKIGPFRVISTPAVDGFGDPQVSWLVECGKHRFLHAGDTLFHGAWWKMANRLSGFDVAFLPINAPVCVWPHLQPPSPLEAVLGPEEAAIAANLLQAGTIVPIHYGSLNNPAYYVETERPVERLQRKAEELGKSVHVLKPGQWTELG